MDSISKFAEALIGKELESIHEGRSLAPSTNTVTSPLVPAGKDIRDVSVPDSFMQQILGESFSPQNTPAAETIPEIVWTDSEAEEKLAATNSSPEMLAESTAQELIPLLMEVRSLLQEMTSAGMLGTNMAGARTIDRSFEKIEASYGYKKPKKAKKAKKAKKTRKQILKSSIRSKIKKK